MLCRACGAEAVGAVTLPCGHLTTCPPCAPKLLHCLECGQKAETFVVAYLA